MFYLFSLPRRSVIPPCGGQEWYKGLEGRSRPVCSSQREENKETHVPHHSRAQKPPREQFEHAHKCWKRFHQRGELQTLEGHSSLCTLQKHTRCGSTSAHFGTSSGEIMMCMLKIERLDAFQSSDELGFGEDPILCWMVKS